MDYLRQVFLGSTGIPNLVSLIGAILLAARALFSAAEQEKILQGAAVLALVFWLGVAFLTVYHALWLVYMLVLASIWPISVVVPK